MPAASAQGPGNGSNAAISPASQHRLFSRHSTGAIWYGGEIGGGLHKGVKLAGFLLGGGFGFNSIGGKRPHSFAMSTFNLGRVMTNVLGKGHLYAGNIELLGEFSTGATFDPESAYFVGLGPLVRYTLATHKRLVPFVEFGSGVVATDIGSPDLGSKFEFKNIAGAGTHWFLSKSLAVSLQYRFLHISNAGIRQPNLGVNNHMFLIGLTQLF